MHAMLIDFTFFAYSVPLANALSELCETTLLLPEQAAEHYRVMVNKQVKLHQFHKPRLRYPSNLLMVRSVFRTVEQIKPDVVHQLSLNLWFNMCLPFFPDIPLVTTIHDASQHPGDRYSIVSRLYRQQRWHRANQVIVHAESIKQQLLTMDPTLSGRTHIVPHGAYDFYRTWDVSEEADEEEAPTVLFFGRILEYKGLQYLIEAEPLITSQVPDARIVIAGRGESFEKYEQMMVNKDKFIVHNYRIPDEMVASLFRQASVVALPYIEASQSGILAIACAFGKPVVASAVGGIPEMLDHGQMGYLVPPKDPHSLAEAIIKLLKDRNLREKMESKASEKATSELSWQAIAKRTLNIYQQALSTN